jgi:hypothetical protein
MKRISSTPSIPFVNEHKARRRINEIKKQKSKVKKQKQNPNQDANSIPTRQLLSHFCFALCFLIFDLLFEMKQTKSKSKSQKAKIKKSKNRAVTVPQAWAWPSLSISPQPSTAWPPTGWTPQEAARAAARITCPLCREAGANSSTPAIL